MAEAEYQSVTIFLVDDDDVDAKCVERAFRKMKVSNPIVRAKDGADALQMLEQGHVNRPYLILLDLNMPRMGGLEMLEVLRNHEQLSSSTVFVLTTSKAEEDKFAAYQQHIAGYIVKEKLHDDFTELVKLLNHYWKIVELPT